MLRDKYRFKLTKEECWELYNTIQKAIATHGNTKDLELMLPIAVLADFQVRIHTKLIFPAHQIKIFLRRTEALAFMTLYNTNIIETTTETLQISHAIDTTI